MNPERWKEVKGNIKENFQVEDEGSERMEEEGGIDIEYFVFQGPLGKMRMEYIVKPVILDKKMTYSNRIGSETKIDYVYSGAEKSHQLVVYKLSEDDGEWVEIEAKNFNL